MYSYSLVKFLRTFLNEALVKNNRTYTSARSTVRDFLESWETKLEKSEVPDPETSVQIIVSHVLEIRNIDELAQCYSQKLTEDQKRRIDQCCECRLVRIPVQYIIREWDFRNVTLRMVPPVFIPRTETESLVDIVKQRVQKLDHVLEIGSGSGAISISLLNENERLKMISVDQSRLACNLTRKNAMINRVDDRIEVHERKLEDDGRINNLDVGQLDAIVSNPPYIFSSELCDLEPEIKLYEDLRALDGGSDGLRVIKAILKYSSATLSPGKSCFLEIHHQHVRMIEQWLTEHPKLNMQVTETFKDVFGYDRFVSVTKIG